MKDDEVHQLLQANYWAGTETPVLARIYDKKDASSPLRNELDTLTMDEVVLPTNTRINPIWIAVHRQILAMMKKL